MKKTNIQKQHKNEHIESGYTSKAIQLTAAQVSSPSTTAIDSPGVFQNASVSFTNFSNSASNGPVFLTVSPKGSCGAAAAEKDANTKIVLRDRFTEKGSRGAITN
jgi:hypothetical protein